MKYKVNLLQIPNQEVSFNIENDKGFFAVDVNLRKMPTAGLVADVFIDGVPQIYGRRCVDRMPLLLNNNLGGNLYFEDQFGTIDPDYHQFNERFLLVYDSAYEVSV